MQVLHQPVVSENKSVSILILCVKEKCTVCYDIFVKDVECNNIEPNLCVLSWVLTYN